MAGGGFSLTDEVLARLAAAFEEQANTVAAAVAPFEAGAIDGMATAWGDSGEATRGPYLEGAAQLPPQIEQIAELLRRMAADLRTTAERSQAADAGAAAMFDSILGGGTGGATGRR